MNLGEFHTEISNAVRRGTSLDTVIPSYTRQAVQWLERNFTFQYQKQFATISIDVSEVNEPQLIELAETRIKEIFMFRWVPSDGISNYDYLKKVDPQDLLAPETGTPLHYWRDGTSRIVLAAVPDEDLSGELYLSKYTPWPTASTATHWLLDHASDMLFDATMVRVGRHIRSDELVATHKAALAESLTTMINAELDSDFANTDFTMGGR